MPIGNITHGLSSVRPADEAPPALPPKTRHCGHTIQYSVQADLPAVPLRHFPASASADHRHSRVFADVNPGLSHSAGGADKAPELPPRQGIKCPDQSPPPVPSRPAAHDTPPLLPVKKSKPALKIDIGKAEAERAKQSQYVRNENERYPNLTTIPASRVTAADGSLFNANYIQAEGNNTGIRTQYPTENNLGSHLDMLWETNPPLLTILASDTDIKQPSRQPYPAYFKEGFSGNTAEVRIHSENAGHFKSGRDLTVDVYDMTLTKNGESRTIPVFHVNGWIDHQACTTGDLHALTRFAAEVINERNAMNDFQDIPSRNLPVAHCNGGIERTYTFLTALHMVMNMHDAMPDVAALRQEAQDGVCPHMGRNEAQMATLSALSDKLIKDRNPQ